jgi:hypothetical protein
MTDANKLAKAMEALESAEAAIRLAMQMVGSASGIKAGEKPDNLLSYAEKAASLKPAEEAQGEGRVIEGVFDGQQMLDKKGNKFPVPANYASKSKLIPGDVLKLTVTDDGKFLYKQIGPVERKTVIGPLVFSDGQYQVLANKKAYNVLLASVTYFRASVGDEVTLIIPMKEDSAWAAIEAVLPKFDEDIGVAHEIKVKTKKTTKKSVDIDEELDI